MPKVKIRSWYDALTIICLLAIAASFIFGLDPVLNGISFLAAAGLAIALFVLIGGGIGLLGWLTIRDGVADMRHDRTGNKAWWWQLFAYAAITGVFIDGAFAAWDAFQKHIMFSEAARGIPFAGVPVLMVVAIYPIKWIEQSVRAWHSRKVK